MTSETLKSCPFCGGEALIIHFTQDACYVKCENHDCMAGQKVYGTKAEAIAAWNARAERTCQRFWTGAEMICSSCAHQLNNGMANYCPNCGARVVSE